MENIILSNRRQLLFNRQKLTFDWIPEKAERLLDAGCSTGYGTVHFVKKIAETWGIDADEDSIKKARESFPDIHFEHCPVEHMPFQDKFFDVVVMSDVLEHVSDVNAAINEIYRVTKSNATIIISTPHTGLFGWFDPYNYGIYLRKRLPKIYRMLKHIKLAQAKEEQLIEKHRHYSKQDLERILHQSEFKSNFTITKVFRSGLFFYPLGLNVYEALRRLFPPRIVNILYFPFRWLAELDYWIPYGGGAYNIAICIKRN